VGTPGAVGGPYEQAVALHRGGQLEQAAALYRDVLATDPEHAGALHLLGVIAGQDGRYAEAAVLIERAIARDACVAAAHANLGNVQIGLSEFDRALESYDRALALQPDHRQALEGRGRACSVLGRPVEALEAYERALDLDPGCGESWLCRGDILLTLGRTSDGISSLHRAAACGADADRIRFALAALGREPVPPAAPAAYVRDLFDGYAGRFDAALTEGLDYRAHRLVARLALDHAVAVPADILDLGCGTGLCGVHVHPAARRLAGVDISSGMLEKARARGVYTELACAEIVEYLRERDAEFDLIVASDVLVYFGDLAPVVAGARRALRGGGCLVYSVEAADGADWELAGTRRYRHSKAYLETVAAAAGFVVATIDAQVLRRDADADVLGLLAVLRVPGLGTSSDDREVAARDGGRA